MQSKNWENFLSLCLNSKDTKQLDSILQLFLTPQEKDDITTRYALIHELLKNEKPQRQISKDLGISIAKITRGSNELKRISQTVVKYLRNHFVERDGKVATPSS